MRRTGDILLSILVSFMLCAGATFAQDMTVSGPLEINGDLSTVDGNLSVDGNGSVNQDLNVGDDLTIHDKLKLNQFSVSISSDLTAEGNVGSNKSKQESSTLGTQTFCALSKVNIAGEDDSSDDFGECSVTGTLNGTWTLYATAGHKTDSVTCAAVCLFSSIQER